MRRRRSGRRRRRRPRRRRSDPGGTRTAGRSRRTCSSRTSWSGTCRMRLTARRAWPAPRRAGAGSRSRPTRAPRACRPWPVSDGVARTLANVRSSAWGTTRDLVRAGVAGEHRAEPVAGQPDVALDVDGRRWASASRWRDPRLGHDHDRAPATWAPPAEVEVVAEEVDPVVEPADVAEQVGADEQCSRRGRRRRPAPRRAAPDRARRARRRR